MYYFVGSGIEIQLELKFLQYMCQIHVLVLQDAFHHSTQLGHRSDFSVKPRNRSALYAKSKKKLSQLDRKDRAMFRLLSTVSLKTNARLPNTKQACLNSNVLRSQGLALQLSHLLVHVNDSILQWIICLWNIYTMHFFHENLQENVECLIYRIHMYKSHVCRN